MFRYVSLPHLGALLSRNRAVIHSVLQSKAAQVVWCALCNRDKDDSDQKTLDAQKKSLSNGECPFNGSRFCNWSRVKTYHRFEGLTMNNFPCTFFPRLVNISDYMQ